MILTIDVGNTRVKSAVFENDRFVDVYAFFYSDFEKKIENILIKYKNIHTIVIASVGKLKEDIVMYFSNRVKIQVITREKNFPFINNYATPQTLGIDRMVLAAGAVLQYPDTNRLIIDAGTCITFDFVDQNNVYHGGAISPGIRLRYEAMHNYTAKLPLLTIKEPEKLIGNSTTDAMHSGVINGVVFEIDGYIDALKEQNQKFSIILTGGDAIFLDKRLKNTIFANSNFLLESLNHLYQYQIKNG